MGSTSKIQHLRLCSRAFPSSETASDCTEKNPRFTARPNTLATRGGDDRKSSGATRNLLDELKENGNIAVAVALPDARATYASRLDQLDCEISSVCGSDFVEVRISVAAV